MSGQGERLLSVTSFSAIGITSRQHKQALQIAAVSGKRGKGNWFHQKKAKQKTRRTGDAKS